MVRSTAHGPQRSPIASVSSSTVSPSAARPSTAGSSPASASLIAAMTSAACPSVNRTPSGCCGADEGSADSAPVHIGRSTAGSRCTVPLGPNVLTSVRSSHSAPHSSPAAPAGSSPADGSASACLPIRRAVTPLQVSTAGRAFILPHTLLGSEDMPAPDDVFERGEERHENHETRVAVAALLGAACVAAQAAPALARPAITPSASHPCGTQAKPGSYKHIIWIFMENHSYSKIIGSSQAAPPGPAAAPPRRASSARSRRGSRTRRTCPRTAT
jgi:hypothetical protein